MSVVSNFTPDQNFWEVNPQLLLATEFKALHKADKSKGKESSSRTMWWVAFCYDLDPANKWRGQLLEDKQKELGLELIGDSDFYEKGKKVLDPLIERYIAFTDSEAKRALRDWEEKMQERRQFIKETKYTLGEISEKGSWVGGTAIIIDNMMKTTKSIFTDYKEVMKDLASEDGEGHVQGGARESYMEELS